MKGETRTIPVTQYLLPDGRERSEGISRPVEIANQSFVLIDRGYRFEAEVLTSGDVYMTLADPAEGVDLVSEVVPNGPEVADAFDRIVRRGSGLVSESGGQDG